MMQNVNPCNCPLSGQTPNAVYDQFERSSNLQLAAASSEHSADIVIATAEEDTVRLSMDAKVQAVALTYHDKTSIPSGDSDTRGRLMGIDIDHHLELSIEGDLNDKERKEIKQVLKAIFKMVTNFLSGKSGQEVERAGAFDDLETIANVSAKFESKDTAAFISTSAAQAVTQIQSPVPEIDAGATGVVTEKPPVAEPAVYAKPMPPFSAVPSKAPAQVLADEITKVVKQSDVDPSKIQKPVDEMFGRLMHRFLQEGPFSFRKMKLLNGLMEEFSHKMKQLIEPREMEAPILEPLYPDELDLSEAGDLFKVQQSTVRTQVRMFEQSFSFSFEYSAAEPGDANEEGVSLEA
jgi:hypothetical protein